MKNNVLDADAISAYAEALAILREARTAVAKVWWDGTGDESRPGWAILHHATVHLKRKQKGFWLITQLRSAQDDE